MITPPGQTAPPWIAEQLVRLLAQRGHAWLLHGPSGLGQYSLALSLAKSWLCEQPIAAGACGHCASCHAVDVRTHADLAVLMPETRMIELGWPLSEKAQAEIDDKKRKASREIRIEAMRDALEFALRTSARGRGKVVLVYPAEAMNAVTANALLKTLEEPVGDTRFVLASEAAHQLLPTIRSRCQGHALQWPGSDQADAWLRAQGVPDGEAAIWLRACGGRPEDALAWARAGRKAGDWAALPRAVTRGDASAVVAEWSPPELIGALQKICHDLLVLGQGGTPRYFQAADLPAPPALASLTEWGRDLSATARQADHPFNPGLFQEALLSQARRVLGAGAGRPQRR